MKTKILWLSAVTACLYIAGCAEPVTNETVADSKTTQEPADSDESSGEAVEVPSVDKAGLQKAIDENEVVFVDFTATWCGPCQMLKPHLHKMAQELSGKVQFVEVDVDDNEDLAAEYGIRAMPTLIVLKGGETVKTIVGAGDIPGIRAAIDAAL